MPCSLTTFKLCLFAMLVPIVQAIIIASGDSDGTDTNGHWHTDGICLLRRLGSFAGIVPCRPGSREIFAKACERTNLNRHLRSNLVGQSNAVDKISAAVCGFLEAFNSSEPYTQPLVLSFHGQTGVGKTYAHYLLAEALFGIQVTVARYTLAGSCEPGVSAIPLLNYHVLQPKVLSIDKSRDPSNINALVTVVEDFDKQDCALFTSLMAPREGPRILVLVSNDIGSNYFTSRSYVSAVIDRKLKAATLKHFQSKCAKDIKWMGVAPLANVSFIQFFPLNKTDVSALIGRRLKQLKCQLATPGKDSGSPVDLEWEEGVAAWAADLATYERGYAKDGFREAEARFDAEYHARIADWQAERERLRFVGTEHRWPTRASVKLAVKANLLVAK